ncbi:MAG TPA: FAD-dependent oxidoreductase [Pirellulales bacterium]|jgi:pyruvate/2-oxoglutarate dehydrogenase complex dihydrolipoamide dehydrogenase (E3) component
MSEQYKNVVIGSGEAGKFLAWALARQGEPSIVVERAIVGGACPTVACLPSKNVIYSAKVASLVEHATRYGISLTDSKLDMAGVRRRKKEMIDGLMELHAKLFHDSGAELLMGHAQFTEPKTVQVALNAGGTRTLRGERIFIAVGTRAFVPNLPGMAEAQPMTHVEALDLDRLPAHLVILGGGYVGLEFAQALRRFGSRVTILQRGAQLLEREDAEFAEMISQILQDDGIEILLNTELVSVAGRSGQGVRLTVRSGGAERTIEASDLLVATGRTPNTDRLGVELGGVALDARGYVRVNERLETTAPDVWAMGECAGSPQFTHVSYDDCRVVLANLSGGARTTRNRLIPYCLFTDPELAHVGLTEKEAREQGIPYRVCQLPMAAIMRTRTHGESRGLAKALIGADDRILGFTALGVEASELMTAVEVAILGRLPYTVFREGIFAHPTTGEGLTALFAGAPTPVR